MAIVERPCQQCGATFHVPEYKLREGKGRYCSKRCWYDSKTLPLAEHFWLGVTKTDNCWTFDHPMSTGYGQMKRHGKVLLAHRVSWELHYGPIPTGAWVLHHCDNPPCVRPDHLFLGSPSDNTQDMWSKGRHEKLRYHPERYIPRGEEIRQSKLSETDIPVIRARWTAGESMTNIGRDYGVNHESIRKIVRGETWTHV